MLLSTLAMRKNGSPPTKKIAITSNDDSSIVQTRSSLSRALTPPELGTFEEYQALSVNAVNVPFTGTTGTDVPIIINKKPY